MNQNFMKEKPIFSLVLSMSLPMVISMMVTSLYNIIDSFFVAKISEDAMTALSLVFPLQNFINAMAIGFSVGINALISFYLGAKDNERANAVATQGVILNAIHGVLISIVTILIVPTFLNLFSNNPQVIDFGCRYSYIAFGFTIIIYLGMSIKKTFQAVGKMKITMVSMLCGCVANIILDPLLIFGIGIFPEMGIEGAALATGLGQTLSLLIYVIIYIYRPIHVKIDFKSTPFKNRVEHKMYSIGIPAAFNLALPSLLISSLNVILASYSQAYVIVLGVYYKLQTFLYLPANGIVQGIRPLVGYNYGAGENKRVKEIYFTSLCLTIGIMIIGTILCWSIPTQLIGLFTSNPQTISIGVVALRIISIGFVISSISVVSLGVLEGLGKGLPSLIISLLRYCVLIIPIAFILDLLIGVDGVWHSFWFAEFLTVVFSYPIYRKIISTKGEKLQDNQKKSRDDRARV